ncbi:MAG TPA: aldolase/citrate lyase family protein [Bryobacteraceae bacterium]|nr:aldolase/citrate lyase family protein [Bryobacteraceae bacterium]
MRINKVKQALAAGKVQLGTGFGQLRSQDVVRILHDAGFHWAFVDTEHGGFDLETVQDLCRISAFVDFCPIVRVGELQYSLVARALDAGAQGIMFPRVESPELLEKAISWTKFPPLGVRGFGLTRLQVDHEKLTIPQIIEHLNANTLVVLQIETRRALEARNELLAVPGIDVVMVGPADLSVALCVGGEFQHPVMVDAMEKIRDSCVARGITPGTQTRSIPQAKFWRERGMRFLGCSNETGMLYEGACEIVRELSQPAGSQVAGA